MKTKLLSVIALSAIAFPLNSALADNVGQCGWGSKLFEGKSGTFPQVLAVTTNGTFGNQTFGISSGTSGCTQDGVVKSNWKTAAFVDGNMNKLALDISRGEGESLESLGHILGVDSDDKNKFASLLKNNFSAIFPSEKVSTDEVVSSLREVLSSDNEMAKYAAVV